MKYKITESLITRSNTSPIDNVPTPTSFVSMKTKIITDPKKMFELCLNQPRVSRDRAIHSILAQNGKTASPAPVKAS